MAMLDQQTEHALNVHFESRLVGHITVDEEIKMGFQYAPSWLDDETSFPVSLSMPLRTEAWAAPTSHNFFANLLPEANVRERVCGKLKISPGNDFELLKAIGGDCAGALTVSPKDRSGFDAESSATRISEAQLAEWSTGTVDAFSAVSGEGSVRLSLAGAQDKLPIRIENDEYLLPQDNLASTHLLKFASPYFSHLPENEAFTTTLATELGLNAVNVELLQTSKARVLVIERYDRAKQRNEWTRLHQEDCCQALGISHLQKYEKEGGPSFKQCADLLRSHSSMPALEIDQLIRWAIFNLIVGNSDAHGKNLSILYGLDGSISLSPCYDLVCTRSYERLDRNLAMAMGGQTDPSMVNATHVTDFAADLQVNPTLVRRTLDDILDRLPAAIDRSINRFNKAWGDSPVLERLPKLIRQQARRTRTMLNQK